jgi:RNA polymerase sigma-70 factor, ECF subfamily
VSGEVAYLAERFRGMEPPVGRRHAPAVHGRFEQIVQRHHRRLRRLVAAVLADPDRVDDVLQEGYLNAYRRLPRRFANEAHEAAWLQRVVFRCCLEELRRVRRRQPEVREHVVQLERPAQEPAPYREIARALRALPDDSRAVLVLVEVLGWNYEAVARELRLPRGTVASRLNAARRRFREALVAEGVRDV